MSFTTIAAWAESIWMALPQVTTLLDFVTCGRRLLRVVLAGAPTVAAAATPRPAKPLMRVRTGGSTGPEACHRLGLSLACGTVGLGWGFGSQCGVFSSGPLSASGCALPFCPGSLCIGPDRPASGTSDFRCRQRLSGMAPQISLGLGLAFALWRPAGLLLRRQCVPSAGPTEQ